MTGIFTLGKNHWAVEHQNDPSLTFFSELQQVLVGSLQQSRSRTRCFNTKPIYIISVMRFNFKMRKTSPYRMYLLRKLCIAFTSLSKKGLYDRGFLSRTRFKTHTVVEDEAWILVREVLMADVRFPNAIMSDINGGLQTDLSVGRLSVFPKEL